MSDDQYQKGIHVIIDEGEIKWIRIDQGIWLRILRSNNEIVTKDHSACII
jgi:hypothetical protein